MGEQSRRPGGLGRECGQRGPVRPCEGRRKALREGLLRALQLVGFQKARGQGLQHLGLERSIAQFARVTEQRLQELSRRHHLASELERIRAGKPVLELPELDLSRRSSRWRYGRAKALEV